MKILQRLLLVACLLAPQVKAVEPISDLDIARMVQSGYGLPKGQRFDTWRFKPLKDDRHTYGAVFYNPRDKGQMVVALRGTVTHEDWFVNASAFHVSPDEKHSIHVGYYTRAQHIGDLLLEVLQSLKSTRASLAFAGHSQGGAVASVLALLWSHKFHMPIQELVTFGAPAAGDVHFINVLKEAVFRQRHYALVGDPVPHIMGGMESAFGYLNEAVFEEKERLTPFQDNYASYPNTINLFSILCPVRSFVSILEQDKLSQARGLINHGMECYIGALKTPHAITGKTPERQSQQMLMGALRDFLDLMDNELED